MHRATWDTSDLHLHILPLRARRGFTLEAFSLSTAWIGNAYNIVKPEHIDTRTRLQVQWTPAKGLLIAFKGLRPFVISIREFVVAVANK